MDIRHLEFWQLILIVGLISGVLLLIVYWVLFKSRLSIKRGDKAISINEIESSNIIPDLHKTTTGVICDDCPIMPNIIHVIHHVFTEAIIMTKMETRIVLDKQIRFARTRLMLHLGGVLEQYKDELISVDDIIDPQFHTDYLFLRPLLVEVLEKMVRHIKETLVQNGLLTYNDAEYDQYIEDRIENSRRYFTEFLDTRYMGSRLIDRKRLSEMTDKVYPTFTDTIREIYREARNISKSKEEDIRKKETDLILYIEHTLGLHIPEFGGRANVS